MRRLDYQGSLLTLESEVQNEPVLMKYQTRVYRTISMPREFQHKRLNELKH